MSRSAVQLSCLVGLLAATVVIWYHLFQREPAFPPASISCIATRGKWDATIKGSRCIVLVNDDWHISTDVFRPYFAQLANWCQSETNFKAILIEIDGVGPPNDVWRICGELQVKYDLEAGGMRHTGGAGRVLWLDHGHLVDHAWCDVLFDEYRYEASFLDALKARTKSAFHWGPDHN